jgi:crotonobetainyl-CoA:carnitine CoA-transferase CaiB-like acyl-CoA transferase
VGQHTRAILRDLLGYKDDRIAELVAAGVVEGPA